MVARLLISAFLALPARAQDAPDMAAIARRQAHDIASARLQALEEDYWSFSVRSNPETAFLMGVPHRDVFMDISPESMQRSQLAMSRFIERLARVEAARADLSPREQIDFDNFSRLLRNATRADVDPKISGSRIDGYTEWPYLYMSMRQTFFSDGKGSPQEWESIAVILDRLPAYYRQAEASVRQAIAAGAVPSRILVEKDGIKNAYAAMKEYRDEFPKRAEAVLGPGHPTVAHLKSAGPQAANALAAFSAYLVNEVRPQAGEEFALGEKETAWRIRNEMGLDMTPKELLAALEERQQKINARVAGIEKELAKQMGIDKSKVYEAVAAAPGDGLGAVERYTRDARRAEDFIRRKNLFELPKNYQVDVVAMPEPLSDLAGAFFYPPPAYGDQRQGAFFVSKKVNDGAAMIAVTATHEGSPGHDTQFNQWRQGGDRFHCYIWLGRSGQTVEGWAMYATQLLLQKDYFTKQEEYMVAKQQEGAINAAIWDLSIHSGAATVPQTKEWLKQSAHFSAEQIDDFFYRMVKMPLQAVDYVVGQMEIERLKNDYQAAKGAAYSEAEFHRELLDRGPMPLSSIRRVMLLGAAPDPDPARLIKALESLDHHAPDQGGRSGVSSGR